MADGPARSYVLHRSSAVVTWTHGRPRTIRGPTARTLAAMSTARVSNLHRSFPARDSRAALPQTADQTRGATNLATRPRAGNISTESRAGVFGR